jgi:hypothetical protein
MTGHIMDTSQHETLSSAHTVQRLSDRQAARKTQLVQERMFEMKTQNLLFVSLMAAANFAFAASGPTTTNQVDLHPSHSVVAETANAEHAVYVTAQRDASSATTTNLVHQHRSSSISASAALQAAASVSPRVIDTNAPTTTNQADLHNVQASVATMQRVQDLHAKKLAARFAQN